MPDEGFFFDELSEAQQDILRGINKLYPKESDKFIKAECRKLLKIARSFAKTLVGTSKGDKKDWSPDKSYHKRFKVGRIYNFSGDKCCRAYNSSPHGHLIELGHKNRDGSFTAGRFVMEKASLNFTQEFLKDCEEFMAEYVDDTINGKF